MNVGIKGFGAYAPENVVDNAYFESFLETSDEWISKMTGIKERRWAGEDEDTTDLAYKASIKAIEDAGIEANDIEGLQTRRKLYLQEQTPNRGPE